MIIINQTADKSFLNFKENQKTQPDQKYASLVEQIEELNPKRKQNVKKTVKRPQIGALLKNTAGKIGFFIENAGDAILASGAIAARFLWNRITTLLMCVWTIPGIIAAVTGGTILICRNYIDKHQYPNGHEKYKIETLDKKAADLESLYNKNSEKYYEKCSSTIFNYYDALNQIKAEKESLENKIANLGK